MPNIVPKAVGSVVSITGANSITSGSYANGADYLTLDNSAGVAMVANFDLTVTFGAAPSTGAVVLTAADYGVDMTTAPPAFGAALVPRTGGAFACSPGTGNSATTWLMTLPNVPIPLGKTRFSLMNASTGQTINANWVLRAQLVTPGT